MRALLALLVASLLLAVPLAHPTSTALACSGAVGPEDADIVIAGTVTDLEVMGDDDDGVPRLTFDVDRYLMGSGPDTIIGTDLNTRVTTDEDGNHTFVGEAGCGAVSEDPRGQYWVLGLMRQADGELTFDAMFRFASGRGDADPAVRDGVARVEESLRAVGLQPAPAGTAGVSGNRDRGLRPAEMVALVLAAGAVVLLGRYTTKRDAPR